MSGALGGVGSAAHGGVGPAREGAGPCPGATPVPSREAGDGGAGQTSPGGDGPDPTSCAGGQLNSPDNPMAARSHLSRTDGRN